MVYKGCSLHNIFGDFDCFKTKTRAKSAQNFGSKSKFFVRNIRHQKYWVAEILSLRNIGSQKYQVSEISGLRNIGYQKYWISEILGLRNIGSQKYLFSKI